MKARNASSGLARRCLAGLCLWLAVGQGFAADAYAGGVAAFKQGDYDRALTLFLEARRNGRDSDSLRYNLAVTYYRLERYQDAARYFRSLLDTQPALAAYNLGLVARAQGDSESAARRFEESLRAAEADSRLASLARRALDSVDAEAAPVGKGDGGVQVAVGYDDNVAFEPAGSRDNRADAFIEGYLWGRYRWSLTGTDQVFASAGVYALRFSDYGRYDVVDMTTHAGWRRDLGAAWHFKLQGKAARLWQDGTAALDSAGGALSLSRELGGGWIIRGGYSGTLYAADDDYDYLDGARHELSTALAYFAGPWWWRLEYVRRWDNRSDLGYEGGFASYSPRSHRLSLSGQYDFSRAWAVDARIDWYRADYPQDDVFEQGGATVSRSRSDRYRGASLGVQRYLGESWRLYGEYRFGRNDSNINANDYNRNVIMLGVGWGSN